MEPNLHEKVIRTIRLKQILHSLTNPKPRIYIVALKEYQDLKKYKNPIIKVETQTMDCPFPNDEY